MLAAGTVAVSRLLARKRQEVAAFDTMGQNPI
jgi:hypothetical protein